MAKIIAIRREDKNKWEKRTPLVPEDIKQLKEKYGIHTIVQPSSIRIFPDGEYEKAGAEVKEDLSQASVIFAVKEIPKKLFERGKTYVFFSHTIKRQSYNMPMLQTLIDQKCNLIDYERIVNHENQRLIFFGRYAGIAGMIETLSALGIKLKQLGFHTPIQKIKQAYKYGSLENAKIEIAKIAKEIEQKGLPEQTGPLTFGISGYGNVSKGAQEILDLFPFESINPDQLEKIIQNKKYSLHKIYKIVFKEEDLVLPKNGNFELQDYYNNPSNYVSKFANYLPFLTVLVNCIYWTEKYPRLITKSYLKESFLNKTQSLKVIGDISCDINGSVEITHKATMPDQANFTYFPESNSYIDGIEREGVTVMAVDNLPCEFPKDASIEFSTVLKDYVKPLLETNFSQDYNSLLLPYPIQKALILHQGQLTDEYKYIEKSL